MHMIAKILRTWPSLVSYWLVESGEKLPADRITDDIKEVEIDEMWHFVKRKNKVWVLKSLHRDTKRTIAWVIGKRDVNTVSKLYNKLEHLKDPFSKAENLFSQMKIIINNKRHFFIYFNLR